MTSKDFEDARSLLEEALFRIMDTGVSEKEAIKELKAMLREDFP